MLHFWRLGFCQGWLGWNAKVFGSHAHLTAAIKANCTDSFCWKKSRIFTIWYHNLILLWYKTISISDMMSFTEEPYPTNLDRIQICGRNPTAAEERVNCNRSNRRIPNKTPHLNHYSSSYQPIAFVVSWPVPFKWAALGKLGDIFHPTVQLPRFWVYISNHQLK